RVKVILLPFTLPSTLLVWSLLIPVMIPVTVSSFCSIFKVNFQPLAFITHVPLKSSARVDAAPASRTAYPRANRTPYGIAHFRIHFLLLWPSLGVVVKPDPVFYGRRGPSAPPASCRLFVASRSFPSLLSPLPPSAHCTSVHRLTAGIRSPSRL